MESRIKIAIVPGHSARRPGCKNKKFNVSEFSYNLDVCRALFDLLHAMPLFQPIIFLRPPGGYKTAMEEMGKILNVYGVKWCLEFHCNGAQNSSAQGHEVWIHQDTSEKHRMAAKIINNGLGYILENRDRGVKLADESTRGYHFLNIPKIKCIIIEPGFFSSHTDTALLLAKKGQYIEGISKFIKIAGEVLF